MRCSTMMLAAAAAAAALLAAPVNAQLSAEEERLFAALAQKRGGRVRRATSSPSINTLEVRSAAHGPGVPGRAKRAASATARLLSAAFAREQGLLARPALSGHLF